MPAYVTPDGDVKLLRNVPIDVTYTHTLYFPNAYQQETYFSAKAKYTFNKLTYVRKNPGIVKVQMDADRLYDCNYMMYRNTAYGNKWFYAFITDIAYVSNTVSAVSFVIDPLQTWLFDMHLGQCYIERQHATSDIVGENLIPEGLETGEYIYADSGFTNSFIWNSYDLIAFCSFEATLLPNGHWGNFNPTVTGRFAYGVYTGMHMRFFSNIELQATIDSFNEFVQGATSAGVNTGSDGILAVVMVPHHIWDENNAMICKEDTHTVPRITGAIDGYTPHNNKLYTAPYVFIEGQNTEGATAIFPQEYFVGTPTFKIGYSATTSPTAICIPYNYKGQERNISEAMYINNFTQCAFNTDMYKAYMAQSLTAQLGLYAVDHIQGIGQTVVNKAVGAYDKARTWWADAKQGIGNFISRMQGNDVTYTAPQVQPTQLSTGGINWGDFPHIKTRDNVDMGMVGAMAAVGAISGIAGSDVAGQVYNSLADLYAKSVAPGHNSGSSNPDYLTSVKKKGFLFFRRTIRQEYARIIDQYFDRFGYAQHKIDTPNIRARDRWTYVKTIDCHVDGNIPAEAVSAIQQIFDNGITWWADTANVGNYSLSNGIYVPG